MNGDLKEFSQHIESRIQYANLHISKDEKSEISKEDI